MNKKIIAIGIIGMFLLASLSTLSAVGMRVKETNENLLKNSVVSQSSEKKWTVMVYLDADNDLEGKRDNPNLIDYFEGLANANIHGDAQVVVQLDRISKYNSAYGDWAKCHRFEMKSGLTPTEENAISDWGDGSGGREVNMGDDQTLIDFVSWAASNYPAEYYCLWLVDHGSGWDGICSDETSDDNLNMTELKDALDEITSSDCLNGKLDILINAACLMGMAEVYYQIKDYVKIAIASQALTGFNFNMMDFDFPPKDILEDITYIESQNPEELVAWAIINDCGSRVFGVNINKINDVANKIDAFVDALIDNMPDKQILQSSKENSEIYASKKPFSHDLYKYAENISSQVDDQTIKTAAQNLKESIENAVMSTYSQNSPPNPKYNGISICLPSNKRKFDSSTIYNDLDFAKDTNWTKFLDEYFSQPVQRRCFSLLQKITDRFPLLLQLLQLPIFILLLNRDL